MPTTANDTTAAFLDALGSGLTHDAEGYVCPVTDAVSRFVFRVEDGVSPNAFEGRELPPTATLYKDGTAIHVLAFSAPVAADDPRLTALAGALGMDGADESIRAPGFDDWSLGHLNAAARYSRDEVLVAYPPDAAVASAAGEAEVSEGEADVASEAQPASGDVTYGNATMVTPYNEVQYDQEVTVTIGGNRQSKQWKPVTMPAGAFIAQLCVHKEGTKDGTAFVLGDMVPGQRLKTSVKALWGVGLDIDTGTPTIIIDNALKKLNHLAVRYSTHSSGKTKTEIKKDKVMKFAGDREIDQELVRYFLREVEQWDMTVVDNAEYIGVEHTEQGIVCQITHPPMPKHRIVLLFKEPFDISKVASSQSDAMKLWAKIPEALGRLLNVPFDTSCTDPSRLFYLPRHAKGKPFSISLFGGSYFDWKTLELDDPMKKLSAAISKGKSKSVTDEGRELGRWSLKRAHGFQIKDVIDAYAPDKIRHNMGHGYEIECPFDEDHSNSGDTEDRACLVVNAGEGPSEFFTISCRHETCRDKTFLDMLGKMIKAGWFTMDVLEDEQFNAILEDGDKPEAARKVEAEDRAKEGYTVAIDQLHPFSMDSEIDAVAEMIVNANLPPRAEERAIETIIERLASKKATVNKIMQKARRQASPKETIKPVAVSERGHYTFSYTGDFDFLDACEVCSKALDARNERDALPTYSHLNGRAVRLDIRDGRGVFMEMSQNAFWSELNKLVTFVRHNENKGGGTRKEVDRYVAAHVCEQAYATMRPAPEVLYTPVYLPDGALALSPGYHFVPEQDVNMLLILNDLNVPDVPDSPTEAEMVEARNWIQTELLSDFPFCDTDADGNERREPSNAHALAMLLTPFMRRMIRGVAPVFSIDKPTPGTGGSLLAKLVVMLFEGEAAEGSYVSYTANEADMAKEWLAMSFQAPSVVVFDDVKEFNNRFLIRVTTSEKMGARVLGRSQHVTVKNKYTIINTGNNIDLGEEMRRRTCTIYLNAKTDDMKNRVFRHPSVSRMEYADFVRENRGLAIRHLLTLVEYWKSQGSPIFKKRRLPSFEDWGGKVGGVLEACGIVGFLDTPARVIVDPQKSAEDEFLREYYKRFGANAPQTGPVIFDWVSTSELGIVPSGHPDERKSRFMSGTLRTLNNRTFKCGEELLMFSAQTDDDGNVVYGIKNLEKQN